MTDPRKEAREIEDMEDLIDIGIMKTLSGKRIAEILALNGFGRLTELRDMVQKQDAILEQVRAIPQIQHGFDDDTRFTNGYNTALAIIHAAITLPGAK